MRRFERSLEILLDPIPWDKIWYVYRSWKKGKLGFRLLFGNKTGVRNNPSSAWQMPSLQRWQFWAGDLLNFQLFHLRPPQWQPVFVFFYEFTSRRCQGWQISYIRLRKIIVRFEKTQNWNAHCQSMASSTGIQWYNRHCFCISTSIDLECSILATHYLAAVLPLSTTHPTHMSQPILAQIAGIDPSPRPLSPQEIEGLTDWFGQYLAKTPVADRKLSFRSLLKEALPAGCYTIYAIADGIPIVYDHDNPDNPLNSVNRNLRFVVIALPDKALRAIFDSKQAILARTLCIVGSANPDGTSAFLQCASWDPKGLNADRKLGIMRFYERTGDGWVYAGDSFNAVSQLLRFISMELIFFIIQFNALSIDRGPFDG